MFLIGMAMAQVTWHDLLAPQLWPGTTGPEYRTAELIRNQDGLAKWQAFIDNMAARSILKL